MLTKIFQFIAQFFVQSAEAKSTKSTKNQNGYYYNLATGLYEGRISNGVGDVNSVFACDGKKGKTFVNPKKIAIKHKAFAECAKVVAHESGTATSECIYIAFTANNYAKRVKKSLHSLLMSTYSTMPKDQKTPLPDTPADGKAENPKYGLARKGLLQVFLNQKDPTNGATHWDGTDFLAWGLKSPYGKSHAKFREYKKITIPKAIYQKYLDGTLQKYPNAKVRYSGTYYAIPASVFNDKKNWTTGDFVYNTGAKSSQTLTATATAGHTIFWRAA